MCFTCERIVLSLRPVAAAISRTFMPSANSTATRPYVLCAVSVAEHHAAAVRAESFVDQCGGARPAGMIERRLVQRGQDALERLPFAHHRAFAWPRSACGYGHAVRISFAARRALADGVNRADSRMCGPSASMSMRAFRAIASMIACPGNAMSSPGRVAE